VHSLQHQLISLPFAAWILLCCVNKCDVCH
jgi:hypothetical protein